jgi:thioredoxin-related protein
MVFFNSPRCSYCVRMKDYVKKMENNVPIIYFDCTDCMGSVKELYKIEGLPTFVIFEGGKEL